MPLKNKDPSKVYVTVNAEDVPKYLDRGWHVENVAITMSFEVPDVEEDVVDHDDFVQALIDRPFDVNVDLGSTRPERRLRIVKIDEGGKDEEGGKE
jgi:hypothetical protein